MIPASAMGASDIYDVSIFAEHVGSQFRIEIDSGRSVAAQLVEASALDSSGKGSTGSRCTPFSLLFSVNGSADLPQRIYNVSHEALGDIQLFMVPLGGGRMESVFN